MQFDRPVQIRNVECSGQFDAAITLDPRDNIVWSGCAVGAGAMLVKFEFFAMGGTVSMTRHAAFQPLSSVEAARIARTITPE